MDEPTSALDKNSEEIFIDTLRKLRGTVTIILISHKDSILNSCDKGYKNEENRIEIIKFFKKL